MKLGEKIPERYSKCRRSRRGGFNGFWAPQWRSVPQVGVSDRPASRDFPAVSKFLNRAYLVSGTSGSRPEAEDEALGQARFKVVGEPSSQLLMRIFGLFAQQDLLPENATVRNIRGGLIVRMKTALISRRRAGVIAEKMRSLVDTHQVEFFWKATL